MPINLANVNISIQQFQAVATGKYNAGEVTLTSETTLDKVNNHVHSRGKNKTELSHVEVLAIKQAFVKALRQSGVAAEVIGIPAGSIGEKLYRAKVYLATPDLFAWTVVIILVSIVFERLFLLLLDGAVRRLERS